MRLMCFALLASALLAGCGQTVREVRVPIEIARGCVVPLPPPPAAAPEKLADANAQAAAALEWGASWKADSKAARAALARCGAPGNN